MHKWTDEEMDIVRRDYRGTNASADDIANRLSVMTGERITLCAVKGQVQKLAIAKVHRQHWTPAEDKRLGELIHRYAPQTVAKKMGRGLNSVVIRARRLRLSRRVRDGWFTKAEVCQILGVDHKWVQDRIDGGQLKASWHNGHKPTRNGSAYWHILETDLKAFLRRYPTELTGRNVDLLMVVEILAGVEIKGNAS